MRRSTLAIAAAAFWCLAGSLPVLADNEKLVQNTNGDVSVQLKSGSTQKLTKYATQLLKDEDSTITGVKSLATITLPDSSTILIGSSSKVQLGLFKLTTAADAKFVVYDGRLRFAVRHPQGAKANYTFSTPTGSIAVRGTQGDIEFDQSGTLRVNVYEVCDPKNPVVVTTTGGARFTVVAGQSLFAQVVNGVVQAKVEQLTQQLINQFAPDFGVPSSWDQATGEVIGAANSKIQGGVNSATGNLGVGGLVPSIGGLFKKKSTPTPAPQPTTSTCS